MNGFDSNWVLDVLSDLHAFSREAGMVASARALSATFEIVQQEVRATPRAARHRAPGPDTPSDPAGAGTRSAPRLRLITRNGQRVTQDPA